MPPTLKDLATKYLREKISSGEWSSGRRLSDFLLSKEIGISRTPIREAINQLVAEGLAEFRPHEGAFVRTLIRRDVEELYEIREILECHCARKAAQSSNPSLLKVLETSLESMLELERAIAKGQEFLDQDATLMQRTCDLEFHKELIAAAGNSKLEKIVGESHLHAQLFSVLDEQMRVSSLRDAVSFHRRLLDAVRRQDPDAAEAAMREHMRCAKSQALADSEKTSDSTGGHAAVPPALRKFI